MRLGNGNPITVTSVVNDLTDVGKGSVVVLLHSSLSTKRQWKSLVERLAQNHRCIAFDLLGYGNAIHPHNSACFSLAEETARIRVRLQNLIPFGAAVHLVGHSYGGAVALRLAQEFEQQTRSLTLFEPVSFHLLPPNHIAVSIIRTVAECIEREVSYAVSKANRSREAIARRLLPATQLFVDFWSPHSPFDRFDVAQQLKMAAMLPKVALDFRALLGDSTRLARLATLNVPTCLLGGRLSPRCSHQLLNEIAGTLPHGELHWVPCGHLAPITDPIRVNPVIESFLHRHDQPRRADIAIATSEIKVGV